MKQLTPYLLFFGLAVHPACSCDGDDGNEQPDAGDIDAGDIDSGDETRTVNGSIIDTFTTATGEETRAIDLSASTIQALVPDGAGGYTVIDGSGSSDGTFTIANVPNGPYLLRVDRRYRLTTGSTVDYGRDFLGRPDIEFASAATTATFDVTGMTPVTVQAIG